MILLLIEILIARFVNDEFYTSIFRRFPGGDPALLLPDGNFQDFSLKRTFCGIVILLCRGILSADQYCKSAAIPATESGHDRSGQQFFGLGPAGL